MNHRTLYAILSDIHGNYHALLAAATDARTLARSEELGEPHFVCLGDVVDYGPRPNACMTWIRQHAEIVIQGNHEAVAAEDLYVRPSAIEWTYWPITFWTRCILDDKHKRAIREWPSRRKSPPGLQRFTLFHNSLVSQTGRVLDNPGDNLRRLCTDFGLCGHDHVQWYVEAGNGRPLTLFFTTPGNTDAPWPEGWGMAPLDSWQELPVRRAIFSPGSIGQPRFATLPIRLDVLHEPHAAYLLLLVGRNGDSRFRFRRVRYPVEKTVKELRQIVQQVRDKGYPKPDSGIGSDVLKDDPAGTEPRHPERDWWGQVLTNLPELLEKLVEETLIPTLQAR